jgi:2-amino-4-hydroxy-6-hydroxymethyldihydropteridine diphosphokinase
MTVTAYVGLGSNLGDRQANLDRAIEALQDSPQVEVTQVSSYYETEPVGGPPGQGDYLNAVLELQTDLTAAELLQLLLDIERRLGRVRRERHGPRNIDLDLLLYGEAVLDESGLVVPHPAMHERGFVLEPFTEIAPDVVHPVLGKTIGELWDEFDPEAVGEDEGTEEDETAEEEAAPRRAEPLTRREPSTATGARAAAATGRELAGLRALVTGSTSGIGRAIALELAAAGAEIIVHGRNEEAAEALVKELDERDVAAEYILGDLAEPEECRRLVNTAWDSWGPIDVWVNNAGADTLTGDVADWSFLQKLRLLLDVDLVATMLMSRDVGKRMKEGPGGVILNIGWDQADTGMEGDSGQLFAATKAAVMAFTRSLAVTLAPEVRVNCLAPGWIRTAWGEKASAPWQERVQRETPLGRWGKPEDVAAAARWLASPAAAFITGQVIRVNGGAVR